MSAKLRNGLKYECKDDRFAYVEIIDPNDLLRCRRLGKSTVDEFILLRGY